MLPSLEGTGSATLLSSLQINHTNVNFIINKLCTIRSVVPNWLCTPVFVDIFLKQSMTSLIKYITILLVIWFLSVLSKYIFETILYSRKFVGVARVLTF